MLWFLSLSLSPSPTSSTSYRSPFPLLLVLASNHNTISLCSTDPHSLSSFILSTVDVFSLRYSSSLAQRPSSCFFSFSSYPSPSPTSPTLVSRNFEVRSDRWDLNSCQGEARPRAWEPATTMPLYAGETNEEVEVGMETDEGKKKEKSKEEGGKDTSGGSVHAPGLDGLVDVVGMFRTEMKFKWFAFGTAGHEG